MRILLRLEPELDAIRDIRMPDPVSRAPQTWGWWVLIAVVLVAAFLVVRAWRRRWLADAYRRAALQELDELASRARDATQRPAALAELPALLKRTALAAFPREDVAGLSSGAWLSFLDRTYPGDAFHRGPGRVLPELTYGAVTLDGDEARALFDAARAWIGGHRA